ncbi:hypothetical protein VNI00_012657 [Paramarasmius palmivorus]|uniref:N-acetyltransferase domain-containing protein n=1 Tax=Paramarasmius palmivorus TaxID=297713 RepID=A0AAW0C5K0_9AGAR
MASISSEQHTDSPPENMSSSSLHGAYVRVAEPHEYPEVIDMLTRAFARDPSMNWFGGVKELVPTYNDQPDQDKYSPATKQTLKNLRAFQNTLVRGSTLQGGFVTVVVIPTDSGGETIAAATVWLKPGQAMDFPISTVLRSGVLKVLFRWGVSGCKRVLNDFNPYVEATLDRAFKSRSLDRLDSWHLLEMGVDPPYEGKGLCSLMMKDGFKRTAPKPVHLEATKVRTRDIYAHYGFEVDEEHCFGKGSVDSSGIIAKGEAATGYPEWVMTKVTSFFFLCAHSRN